ncbi:hypothetical protein SBBP2_710002 [Burkholderiales bacterium]|nr:hypothetical protein SBBP2_710002 [Burkholderiales bacterium]
MPYQTSHLAEATCAATGSEQILMLPCQQFDLSKLRRDVNAAATICSRGRRRFGPTSGCHPCRDLRV